jgi:hypothetical protein
MNKVWILSHLRESCEELTRIIARIDAAPDVDDIEFEISLRHVYSHLNTAWNSRAVGDHDIAFFSDEDSVAWRAFPADLPMSH